MEFKIFENKTKLEFKNEYLIINYLLYWVNKLNFLVKIHQSNLEQDHNVNF